MSGKFESQNLKKTIVVKLVFKTFSTEESRRKSRNLSTFVYLSSLSRNSVTYLNGFIKQKVTIHGGYK